MHATDCEHRVRVCAPALSIGDGEHLTGAGRQMVIDREIPDDDFWATEDPQGTASTWIFRGAEGLARLSADASYSAPEPGAFDARLTRVQIDHLALEGLAATEHTATRTAAHVAAQPTSLLRFTFVRVGRLRVELEGATFEIGPEEFLILDSRDPVTLIAETEVRTLTSVIGIEHVPAHLLTRGTTIAAPLARTPLADSFVAFQATVLSSSMRGRTPQGGQLIRAVAELHSAVLAEAQQMVGEPTGPAALRFRMEEYVDAHLADPDLRPETIAEAVGISLRHAHNVFNTGDRTIGRFIRDRRTEALALALRTGTDRVPLAELAATYGFVSADAMSRSFRERFGMSPSEYRADGHRALG